MDPQGCRLRTRTVSPSENFGLTVTSGAQCAPSDVLFSRQRPLFFSHTRGLNQMASLLPAHRGADQPRCVARCLTSRIRPRQHPSTIIAIAQIVCGCISSIFMLCSSRLYIPSYQGAWVIAFKTFLPGGHETLATFCSTGRGRRPCNPPMSMNPFIASSFD